MQQQSQSPLSKLGIQQASLGENHKLKVRRHSTAWTLLQSQNSG
ncbi:MAG: hypothetical protein WAN66_08415 [Limnoraphis robusta]|jgi:hypothetical protein|nr:hypothetical protein [Limnoraphis robusta]MEA5496774.1 hypothetical protein [Limnoraphis robusta BA-68 BA1]MEA5541546.1 hypothetical protein [Limnoraphis robusta Tam1]MEA5546163.1 hypothetical protein [Limnoraphis robusta CCNP1324]